MWTPPPALPAIVLRVSTALLLAVHGYYRFATGGVTPFGGYLTATGVPLGSAVAWGITLFEMVAFLPLVLGRFVLPVAAGHVLILAAGIVMVHGPEGWFVVGGGRNGVEYSVLLIACLVSTALAHPPFRRPEPARPRGEAAP